MYISIELIQGWHGGPKSSIISFWTHPPAYHMGEGAVGPAGQVRSHTRVPIRYHHVDSLFLQKKWYLIG